jgi:uncharacterized protein (DUF362 family)
MQRRAFLQMIPAASAALASVHPDVPTYRVVTRYKPAGSLGMPGQFAARVISVHAEKSIDPATELVNAPVVKEMLAQGMRGLVGKSDVRDCWAHFFSPSDVVGIKVNCSGAPGIMSTPALVAGIVDNLIAVGLPSNQIYIYERFPDQMDSVHYDRFVPAGVQIHAVEKARGSILNYDPNTYVEVSFFGEEDTRSNMVRLVTERLTKIINVPNMKDHGAAGVTGCLKNIAYGSFSNVARSHYREKTNTYSFIGTLASTEPLRSRTVLNIMDGLRGVWHGGPFSPTRRFRFYPKRINFGTDPVAMDRLLLDIIDDKRKAEGAVSVWDRSMDHVRPGRDSRSDPNLNAFIREPGHIEYAAGKGLGVYDIQKIQNKSIEL